MLSFSQRIGKKPDFKELQIEVMDDDLRNSLWNVLKITVLDPLTVNSYSLHEQLCKSLWINYFKYRIDEMPVRPRDRNSVIRSYFFQREWFCIYDLLEAIAKIYTKIFFSEDFIESFNTVLEKEFSAYRFINGIIAPISNNSEIETIKEVLTITQQFSGLSGANIHLYSALEKISDRKKPDYRNSIKESISAVEACCRILTGENTLGKALNKLEKAGIKINKQLKDGFEKIYAYTNGKDSGIRHAMLEEEVKTDFEDAKYMLVSCSAFINYLIVKANKAGIEIK